jgi:hypothetical protein
VADVGFRKTDIVPEGSCHVGKAMAFGGRQKQLQSPE